MYQPTCRVEDQKAQPLRAGPDRKSTRLNSSHANISYAVFCLKKKKADHVLVRRRVQLRVNAGSEPRRAAGVPGMEREGADLGVAGRLGPGSDCRHTLCGVGRA